MQIVPNYGGSFLVEGQRDLAKKYGIESFDYPSPDSQVRSIGFNPKTKTWYGWSHRAIAGFKVGDRVKAGDVIAKGTAADLRGGDGFEIGFTAKSLDDAKAMAAKFANEVA